MWLIIWHEYFMEEKYCMSMGTQLNVFHASKFSVWLNYVKSPFTKKYESWKYVTPEEVSTSTNLNICYILLHGKKTIAEIEWQFCLFNFFAVSLYYWLIVWLSFLVSNKLSNAVVDLTLRMYHRIYIYIYYLSTIIVQDIFGMDHK
jgi:hypothetical protein